jgi:2-keto-4-pentenoate hydratase/2-oxohepta-3-ene-1,7-dioic acid hydratase in catechol pathway
VRIARFVSDDQPQYGVIGFEGDEEIVAPLVADPMVSPIHLTGQKLPLADVRLLAPVLPRSKVVAVGRNYAEHAAELGNEVPAEPLLFLKPNTSVIGPGEAIVHPRQSSDVQYEGELAVVIGRVAKDIPADRFADVVFGYTVANDVTARDLQRADVQFTRAKGFDTFCPLGPWIETDLDPSDLAVRTVLDGQVVQDGRTSQMIHAVPALVAFVTSVMTLLPGDVLLTGTPAGVGTMRPGSEVSVEVEGIGVLTNRVVDVEADED